MLLGSFPVHLRYRIALTNDVDEKIIQPLEVLNLQVQEAGLTWKSTLLSNALSCLGPHALPFQKRLTNLLDSLLALPSVVSPASHLHLFHHYLESKLRTFSL